ncbi:MAG TPA: hypothetical protein DCZ38_02155 [Coxiellaceae bacterium]|nr:MAG: hypothetical protein A2V89_04865 [Gammaproteobacteria bacterium RBG_16_37_9]HBC71571.1 hypothetical protein [Coxiellaceae bacterium]
MNVVDKDGIVHISGELNFVTVPMLSKNNRSLITNNSEVIFDLSQVTISDNTGVALLIALTSYAKDMGKKISFINLPKQLLELVAAGGVRDILPIL